MVVRGLDKFRDAFSECPDAYVLIGGSACDVLMEQQGESFRATKDLDVIVLAEGLDSTFSHAFWNFIQAGGYVPWRRKDERLAFYRFVNPADPGYPSMIELFSRHPDFELADEDSEIAPLPLDEDVSSLSAIVLDDDYYGFIRKGARAVGGVTVLDAEHIIPLKMRAHVDLNERHSRGQHVNSADLKMHRKDVFRLLALIPESAHVPLPGKIAADVERFMATLDEPGFRIEQLGLGLTLIEAADQLRTIYGLAPQ